MPPHPCRTSTAGKGPAPAGRQSCAGALLLGPPNDWASKRSGSLPAATALVAARMPSVATREVDRRFIGFTQAVGSFAQNLHKCAAYCSKCHAHGPYEPAAGHRFNPNKLLLDRRAFSVAM